MSAEVTEVYEEKLEEIREAIRALNKLMQSEDDDIILRAVDFYLQLCELEFVLIYAIDVEPVR